MRWTLKVADAFGVLKVALSSSPVLWNSDFCLPFRVQTDASETGLGAVLFQEFEGEEHLVIYISHKLTLVEQHYMAIKQEALAIK